MHVTSQQVEKLLKGSHSFSQVGLSMLLTRLKNVYAKNPSQATLQNCVKEIDAFLEKYKSILGNDYSAITKI